MRLDYTSINIVLDRSGSMQIIRTDTIGGFNSFLKEQKEAEGKADLSLVQFDTEREIVYDMEDVQNVSELTEETFIPRGMTALLDALGSTINRVGQRLASMDEDDRPGNVLFVVITDGHENSSKEFTREQIFDMIKHQQDVYNWQFIYLGANQDAIQVGTSLGFSENTSVSYAAGNIDKAFDSVSEKTCVFRSFGDASVLHYNQQERLDLGDSK